jgi:CRP-like cAMP-binding protein
MLLSVQLKKFNAGETIISEGEQGNDLFIIAEGSACVYTKDMNDVKITLKQLAKGDYFGEQAILGKIHRTRNSNIEALTDTTVIQIGGDYFSKALQSDASLKSQLEDKEFKQALNIMSVSSGFHNNIESILAKIENPKIVEFRNNEYIFRAGDKPDYVYMILQGKVKLLIPDKKSGAFYKLLLNRGHLFGELSIIKDAPRSATAIAHSNLKLLAIDGSYFKNDISITADFKSMISTLQQIYELPMRGTVEQYVGDVSGLGNAILNIYKLDDGRQVLSSRILKQDIFTMARAEDNPAPAIYQYSNGSDHIELEVTDHHLIGIKAYGNWEALPELCRILLDNEIIEDTKLENFQLTGKIKT